VNNNTSEFRTPEEWSNQTKKDEVGVVAIDFDNVIHNNDKGFHDGTCYGEPTDGAIESIREISKKFRIVIYSFKGHPDRPLINGKNGIELVWDWLKKYKIDSYIEDIVWGKPNAVVYIDDKGYRFENWKDTMIFLENILK
jgi:hypothetical protein|tara:strand:+ start:691 stop:1110 length:420 start_codon:yes stop_codon:yes gene_type:complete